MYSFQQLSDLFEIFLQQNTDFPSEPIGLYAPCSYFLSSGGKRVRPVSLLMANEMWGELRQEAWHAAMAYELFHNFTLVHDDIMDASHLRRGKETVHKKYGLTAGILSGDVISIYAYRSLEKMPPDLLAQVITMFNRTAIQVCEGQQWDMQFEMQEDVSIDDYISMISLKTSVLLAACLATGAILAQANARDIEHIYQFGKNLGIAFQLQDDYLDVYGQKTKTGKQIGNDIKANKKTYLHLKTKSLLSAEDLPLFQAILEDTSEQKIERMVELYEKTNVQEYAHQIMDEYYRQSIIYLENVNVSEQRKIELIELATFLMKRDY